MDVGAGTGTGVGLSVGSGVSAGVGVGIKVETGIAVGVGIGAGVGVGAAVGTGTRLGTDRRVATGVGSDVDVAVLAGDSILAIAGEGLTTSCPTHAIRKIPNAAKGQQARRSKRTRQPQK
ncbi:MAG: hypothetical protein BZY68_01145 [SAR202 cluster bacterium MP-SAtl-SRR3965592-G2]|nr:MAG: hypothetical protein BZY68_01145 [SAR202 cluster bacterium MP-SAtl-SRR3965592-G2]